MFVKTLSELLKEKKITQAELARELGVHRQNIYQWLTGKTLPRPELIVKIASYFNVTVDYLLQDETSSGEILGEGNVATNALTPQEQELVRLFRNLPVKDQTHFLAELYKKE